MSFPGSILPNRTPKKIVEQGGMMVLQDRILQFLLLGIFALGVMGSLALIPPSIQKNDWRTIAFSIILAIIVGVIIILRDLRFQIRAGLLVAILFVLTMQFLLINGPTPETFIFLYGMVFYAGFFFGPRLTMGLFAVWTVTAAIKFMIPDLHPIFSSLTINEMGKLGSLASIVEIALISGSTVGSHLALSKEYKKSLGAEHAITAELRKERANIDQHLQERTYSLQRRLLQSRVAAQISQSITSILNPDELLQKVVDLMLNEFKLYYIGTFVLDTEKRYAVLRAGTGDAGQRMLADGFRLSTDGTSMIGWSIQNKKPRIALDTGNEAVRFNNPHLPYTRSELALPIISKGQVLGAMTVQSIHQNAFDDDDVVVLQGIANILGSALDNARLYKEAEESLEEVRAVNRDYLERVWSETAQEFGGLDYTYDNPVFNTSDGPGLIREFPLTLRDQVIGYIAIDTDRDELSPEETAFIEGVTSQTAVALENARLLQETQRHALTEQKLNTMVEKFSQAVTIEEIVKNALKELGELPAVAEVSIHLVPPSADGGNGRGNQEDL